ncbi:MAG TPA: ATP-binding protein [Actinomycetota bacterium]|nr:ATP-binding protein [Actinomycetota bacterium]
MSSAPPTTVESRILVVDDEEANVSVLLELLRVEGYLNVVGTTDPREALRQVEIERPDLVLLDLMMPVLDGFAVMETLHRSLAPGDFLPIIVLTADVSHKARDRALREGANDFVTKPVDHTELLLRMTNLLEARRLHSRLRARNDDLERRVQARTRALQEAAERERAQARRLQQSEQVKDALLVAVSHDIRTPLTLVVGLAETLVRRVGQMSPAQLEDVAEGLCSGARRLETVLTNLLDVDRLRRGLVEPFRVESEMSELVERVIGGLAIDTTQHRLVVSARPLRAAIDPGQVERIVESLVANAVRHTPPGTTIWVRCEPGAGTVLLSVEDDGPGIADGDKSRIFEAFEGTRDNASPGSGNGLTLVKGFANLHGGDAWVEDRPGGGSRFRVVLPTTAA